MRVELALDVERGRGVRGSDFARAIRTGDARHGAGDATNAEDVHEIPVVQAAGADADEHLTGLWQGIREGDLLQ